MGVNKYRNYILTQNKPENSLNYYSQSINLIFEQKLNLGKIRDEIIYQVWPRYFSNEGTFEKVIEKLPSIKSLGVTIIYNVPIHPIGIIGRIGTLGSPYSIKDYDDINIENCIHKVQSETLVQPDNHFMPIDETIDFNVKTRKIEFKNYVKAVHEHNMKFIIDIVINHCSKDNILLTTYPNISNLSNIPSDLFNWDDTTTLNEFDENYVTYFSKYLKYFITEYDVDGYRFDVSFDINNSQFWKNIYKELKILKNDILIIQETDMTYFDLSNNIEFPLRREYLLYDFPYASINSYDSFYPTIYKQLTSTSYDAIHPVNTHDSRVILSENVFKMKLIISLILPGSCFVYQGIEGGYITSHPFFDKAVVDFNDYKYTKFISDTITEFKKYEIFNVGRIYLDNFTLDIEDSLLTINLEYNDVKAICFFNLSDVPKTQNITGFDILNKTEIEVDTMVDNFLIIIQS